MKLLNVLFVILAILLIAMFIKTRREYFANPRELSTAFTFKNNYRLSPEYPSSEDTSDENSIFVAIKNAIYKNY